MVGLVVPATVLPTPASGGGHCRDVRTPRAPRPGASACRERACDPCALAERECALGTRGRLAAIPHAGPGRAVLSARRGRDDRWHRCVARCSPLLPAGG